MNIETPSNKDLAKSFATLHHLATLALCPDTPPAALEKAIIRIANESEPLADHFQSLYEGDISRELWIDLPLNLAKELGVQS